MEDADDCVAEDEERERERARARERERERKNAVVLHHNNQLTHGVFCLCLSLVSWYLSLPPPHSTPPPLALSLSLPLSIIKTCTALTPHAVNVLTITSVNMTRRCMTRRWTQHLLSDVSVCSLICQSRYAVCACSINLRRQSTERRGWYAFRHAHIRAINVELVAFVGCSPRIVLLNEAHTTCPRPSPPKTLGLVAVA
jgi:hypothetical protein